MMSIHVTYISHIFTMTAPVHKSLQESLQLTPHSWSSLHPLLHILPRQTSWQSAKRRLLHSSAQTCRYSGSAENQVHARVSAHGVAQLANLQTVGTRQIHILAAQQARLHGLRQTCSAYVASSNGFCICPGPNSPRSPPRLALLQCDSRAASSAKSALPKASCVRKAWIFSSASSCGAAGDVGLPRQRLVEI